MHVLSLPVHGPPGPRLFELRARNRQSRPGRCSNEEESSPCVGTLQTPDHYLKYWLYQYQYPVLVVYQYTGEHSGPLMVGDQYTDATIRTQTGRGQYILAQQSELILVGDQYTGATSRTRTGRANIFIGSFGPGCGTLRRVSFHHYLSPQRRDWNAPITTPSLCRLVHTCTSGNFSHPSEQRIVTGCQYTPIIPCGARQAGGAI